MDTDEEFLRVTSKLSIGKQMKQTSMSFEKGLWEHSTGQDVGDEEFVSYKQL
jgi:hypothetical protein